MTKRTDASGFPSRNGTAGRCLLVAVLTAGVGVASAPTFGRDLPADPARGGDVPPAPADRPLPPPGVPRDTPVIVPLLWWGAAAVGAGAISWGVGKALDSATAQKPPKAKAQRVREIKVRRADGSEITQRETVTIDPPLTDLQPLAVMSYPDHWSPQPFIPGDRTMGSSHGIVDVANETLRWQYQPGLGIGTDINPVISTYNGVAGTDEWRMTETVDNHMKRPADPGALDAKFSFSLSNSLRLTTVDQPETEATVGYDMVISSPQLGVIWTGGVEIDEGSMTPRLIGPGLPGAVYTVLAPGVLEVTFSPGMGISIDIPNTVDFLDLEVEMISRGSASYVPAPGPATMLLSTLLLAARRRRAA